jgi:ferredoxin
MSGLSSICRSIESALEPSGILLRGTLDFRAGEGPMLTDRRPAASVLLLGNVGSSIWPAFSAWNHGCDGPDPLDTWSKQIIGPLAEEFGGTAYFPSDPPWQPFQRWAMRAEGLKPSPLGILIHPQFGLWHGYRGAIGFPQLVGEGVTIGRHPCDSCQTKPCLSVCPVNAVDIDPGNFTISSCRDHLETREGRDGCMGSGCLARNACPVGVGYRYETAQMRFHMQALS